VKHVGAWVGFAGWRASRSPDMYPVDMRLEDVTKKTVLSDHPTLGCRLGRPTWLSGSRGSATVAVRLSNRGDPCCRLKSAARSPVDLAGFTDRGAHPTSGSGSCTGRLLAGSNE